MKLLRRAMIQPHHQYPSQFCTRIRLLENGLEDPVLAFLLILLRDLDTPSLEGHPVQALLVTNLPDRRYHRLNIFVEIRKRSPRRIIFLPLPQYYP